MWFAVYLLSDGRFVRGSVARLDFEAATEGLVVLETDTPPDPITERYDANSPTRRRAATPVEVTAAQTSRRQAIGALLAHRPELRAVLELLLRRTLGRTPTPAERDAARTEYLTILNAIID